MGQAFGYRVLQPLFDDPELEEIIINGAGIPVMVHHRDLGICMTDLSFPTEHELSNFLSQMGATDSQPFQDVMLPDGSRANVALSPPAIHPTITIRKFRYQPMSVVDLIQNRTLSPELAAFLWVAADGLLLYPLNILIVGGTASGKTTTLNALSVFVPPHERIVSIEDTQELNFSQRKDWVALEADRNISLDDLLRNSLRMRPDRLVVGEVRGPEAETLFTAMNVGHRGTMGTLHANSDRDAIRRLENPPMSVPKELLPLVDIIVVQQRVNHRKKGMIRRIVQVSEVTSIENNVAVNEIFKWDAATDELIASRGTTESKEKLARAAGISINQGTEEVESRRQLIEVMLQRNITTQKDISLFMQAYYLELFKKGGVSPIGFEFESEEREADAKPPLPPSAKPSSIPTDRYVKKTKDGIELV